MKTASIILAEVSLAVAIVFLVMILIRQFG